MATITATPVPEWGHIRVEIDWSDVPGVRKAWVRRRVGGVLTTIRGGNPVLLSGGKAIIYDTEMPLDQAVSYQSTTTLNTNGDFEDGVAEWLDTTNTGTLGTVTQTKDYHLPQSSTAALRLVQNSSNATLRAASEYVAATVGTSYTVSGWLMVPDWWTGGVGLQINWHTGADAFISASGSASNLTPVAGEWEFYTLTATAPATTAKMRAVPTITGTPSVAMPLYADDIFLTSAATTIETAPVVVSGEGGGWWKDPLHPATAVRLLLNPDPECATQAGTFFVGSSGLSRPSVSSLDEVPGAKYGVAQFDVRKAPRTGLRVLTRTREDREQVEALHASGAPLLLQQPQQYQEPDRYGLYGELSEERLTQDHRYPWRLLGVSYTEVLPPIGPADGVYGTRYEDLDLYETYQSAEASGGGLLDTFTRNVASGWGSPDTGPAWTTTGVATNFNVNGTTGTIATSLLTSTQSVQSALSLLDARAYVDRLSIASAPTGAGGVVTNEIVLRFLDANNFVSLRVFRTVNTNAITTALRQFVAGVETNTGFPTVSGLTASDELSVLFEAVGTTIRGKVWKRGNAEPAAWHQTVATTWTTAGGVRLSHLSNASITNSLPYASGWDGVQVTNLAAGAGNTWYDGMQGELT